MLVSCPSPPADGVAVEPGAWEGTRSGGPCKGAQRPVPLTHSGPEVPAWQPLCAHVPTNKTAPGPGWWATLRAEVGFPELSGRSPWTWRRMLLGRYPEGGISSPESHRNSFCTCKIKSDSVNNNCTLSQRKICSRCAAA